VGTQQNKKYIILIGILMLTCALVYFGMKPSKVHKKPALKSFFRQLEGYTPSDNLDLSKAALRLLDLDDYTLLNFLGKNGKVNLYIGYYATADKAYAAHSPLVCYPSQGWEIKNKAISQSFEFGQYKVNYDEITTALGEEKELVMYWYQVFEKSNTKVYQNKFDMGYNKLIKNDEQHAFVRVAVPYLNKNYDEVKAAATEFIKVLYPQLIAFFALEDNPSIE
jgi:EpsI family protein